MHQLLALPAGCGHAAGWLAGWPPVEVAFSQRRQAKQSHRIALALTTVAIQYSPGIFVSLCPCLCSSAIQPPLRQLSFLYSIVHPAAASAHTHSLHPHHDPVTTTESYRSGLYRMKSFWKPSVLLILVRYGLCAMCCLLRVSSWIAEG